MQSYLKEKIGNPELFTGRSRELTFYLNWIEGIKKERSQSSAILSRRKTGKTAFLQRLYNVTFAENNGVIPFYYEVPEGKQWAVNFCQDFYLSFVYQYIAFKTRNAGCIAHSQQPKKSFAEASAAAWNVGEYLVDDIAGIQRLVKERNVDLLWAAVRETPWTLAAQQGESIVQIIDEFQYLNSEICRDRETTQVIDDLASGYMRTAEYKNAPLLVSGSWVGWLFSMLNKMTGRFQMDFLEPLPEHEAVEMVFRYSQLEEIPVTEETAYLIAQSCEGNPAYVSSVMRSRCPKKDLTTEDGVLQALEFETLDERGAIKRTWMEYLYSALPRINDRYAKQIVLYLCKHKERRIARRELIEALQLEMSEEELREKMEALIRADIINRGGAISRYQAVQDNIFDKVFRGEFGGDIEDFDEREITQEYKALFEETQKKYRQLLGKYNQQKGAFAEFQILKKLRIASRRPEFFRAMIHNLPDHFEFADYTSVWPYYGTAQGRPDFQVDIWAQASEGMSMIGEIKNRDNDPFDATEAQNFLDKFATMRNLVGITDALGFVYSRSGFTNPALDILREQHIAYSDDERWLD